MLFWLRLHILHIQVAADADLLFCLAVQLLYKSTGFIDELAWAAAWLYKATGTASYLADAKKYYSQVCLLKYSIQCWLLFPVLSHVLPHLLNHLLQRPHI